MFEKMRKAVYNYVVAHLDVTDNVKFTLDDVSYLDLQGTSELEIHYQYKSS